MNLQKFHLNFYFSILKYNFMIIHLIFHIIIHFSTLYIFQLNLRIFTHPIGNS